MRKLRDQNLFRCFALLRIFLKEIAVDIKPGSSVSSLNTLCMAGALAPGARSWLDGFAVLAEPCCNFVRYSNRLCRGGTWRICKTKSMMLRTAILHCGKMAIVLHCWFRSSSFLS